MGIPCHVIELMHFRDQLETLTAEYGIPIRSELVTSADEMELFGAVNRHFKGLFNRQIECSTFHHYDNPPEGTVPSYYGVLFRRIMVYCCAILW